MSSKIVPLIMILGFVWAQFFLTADIKKERIALGAEITLDESAMDPMEFLGTMVLSSFRGVIVDFLWLHTRSNELNENIEQLPVIYNLITSLQPTFLESTKYAASNLAFDISARFESSDEKWIWIYHALKLCDKSIKRNANHPEAWKIVREKAQLITRKCLKNSDFVGKHGEQCYELFKKTFGRDPNEVAVELYRQVMSEKDIPGVYIKDYEYAYEKWAESFDDPEQQYEKMRLAGDAWAETLKVRGDVVDTYSKQLAIKIEMARRCLAWHRDPSEKNWEAWIQNCRENAGFLAREPLMRQQTKGQVNKYGVNMYADVLFRLAAVFSTVNRDDSKLIELATHVEDLEYMDGVKGYDRCAYATAHLKAKGNDFMYGATQYHIQQLAKELAKDPKKKKVYVDRWNSHRQEAIKYYKKMQHLLQKDQNVFKGYLYMDAEKKIPVTAKNLKTKISLLEEAELP